MTDTIVVGVDDSSGARAALAWAVRQVAATEGRLRVVYVFEAGGGWINLDHHEVAQWEQRAQEQADDTLSRIVHDVMPPSRRDEIELRAIAGSAADILRDQARGAALLVVGSRGQGGFASLGSVSQRLARDAPCPLVIIPPLEAHTAPPTS